MKLISCYIEGFGKFSAQSFTFSPTLTVLKEENGWGKTTLADFIKCMLYGMDNGRGKAVSANDRLKYEPWRGGGYGGYLLFSANGKTYRVERSFGRTAAVDTVRIYDANNMPCYEFGEKGERLGETLFGVNGESFSKSVYVPQGDIETGISDDMKNKLLSLLSTGGRGENGAERAIALLDDADRKLRSRRKPLKGKLDEIDERLELVARKRLQKQDNLKNATLLRQQAASCEREIDECGKRIAGLNKELEEFARRKEREVRFQAAQSVREELQRIDGELSELSAFFKGVNPLTANLDGLQKAVSDFYALKEELGKTEEELRPLFPALQSQETLLSQIAAYEKQLASYEEVLSKTGGAGTRSTRGKKIIPQKRKSNFWIGALSFVLAIVGSVTATKNTGLGLGILGLGFLGAAFVFLRVLPRYERVERQTVTGEQNERLRAEYEALKAELFKLQERANEFPKDLDGQKTALLEKQKQTSETLQGLENGILRFLGNFAFAERYDYRACVNVLKDKISQFKRLSEEKVVRQKEWNGFSQEELAPSSFASGDATALKREKAEWEERRERLLEKRTENLTGAAQYESQITGDLAAEEGELRAEKERLEKRRKAILAAKELLERAKANMASRYLVPVETGCKTYLAEMGFSEPLRFTAAGTPTFEALGKMRETEYYSQGIRELLGLCMRIALVDAVYQKEKPVLILDDPLVNLDDKKTAKAKEWIKSLSGKYQIVYLTCKSERKI